MAEGNKLFLGIAAFFFPPLAVGIKKGFSGTLLLNILLTLSGLAPGVYPRADRGLLNTKFTASPHRRFMIV
jgi:uncharacterized membrane protein YqaE (UPF0057 family)